MSHVITKGGRIVTAGDRVQTAVTSADNVIRDGSTVAWYDSSDLTTITKNGSDFVSRWNDKLGSGRDLLQATAAKQPKWYSGDGVLFDGVDDGIWTNTFSLITQPLMIYLVIKVLSLKSGNIFISGANGPQLNMFTFSQMGMYAGNYLPYMSYNINSYYIIRLLFNGSFSKENINTTLNYGHCGFNEMGFISLGSYIGGINNVNIQVKEVILRNVADNTEDETTIYNYLANKYGFTPIDTTPTFDAYTTNLVNRLTAKGETPNLTRQNAMDKCIKSLRANDLFENQFDVLVVTRGYGEFTTKENWIKDAHHALGVNNPTYTAGVGYNSDGSASSGPALDSQYNAVTQGFNYSLNNASFMIKNSGTIGTGDRRHGWGGYPIFTNFDTIKHSAINSTYIGAADQARYAIGWNLMSRNNSNSYEYLYNSTIASYGVVSSSISSKNAYLMAHNRLYGTPTECTNSTEILELYALGKSLTQQQFLTFQNIFNQYFLDIDPQVAYVPKVGDLYGGGIVAYILQSGDPGYEAGKTKGLIAATSDMNGIWHYTDSEPVGTTSTSFGTGLANTNAIIALYGSENNVAKLCRDYNGGGYNDWYMPSFVELYNALYANRLLIGGFGILAYFSSSEYNASFVRKLDFSTGAQDINNIISYRDQNRKVRPVRSFTIG